MSMKIIKGSFVTLLVLIAYEDAKTKKISNKRNLLVLLLGMAAVSAGGSPPLGERIAGFFAVSLPMAAMAWITRGGIGGGDIKLMASGGFFVGVRGIFPAAMAGFFAGAVYGCFLLIFRKAHKGTSFAFGPFLCAGLAAEVIWGSLCTYNVI